jgi:hypothetical protein
MDPYLDPDPSVFVINLHDANQKTNFLKKFFLAYYFLKVHLHDFLMIKGEKEVTKRLVNFLAPGSGFRRAKSMRIGSGTQLWDLLKYSYGSFGTFLSFNNLHSILAHRILSLVILHADAGRGGNFLS